MAETSVTVVATKRDGLDPYIKILQNQSNNNIDVSFSSYLKPDNNNKQQQKEQEDAEIIIFEARKYFSESENNDKSTRSITSPRFSSVSSAKVSSEASWNSQTGLLCNKNRQGSNRDGHGSSKKGSLLGSRWFFRRRTCPCSSSKSVQVQETKSRIEESRTGSNRIVSNRIVHHNHQTVSSSDPIRLRIPSNTVTRSIDYEPNVSTFSFPTCEKYSASESCKLMKLNMTLNEEPKNPTKPVLNPIKPVQNPTSPKGVTTDEEATSDASSDLFEIESFSAQPAARPWAPPETANDEEYGYEPSEASVTWSVTTAEPVATTVAANLSRIGLSAFSGQRLVQPLKSVSVQENVVEKVLCNNGICKVSVTTTRTMFDNKSSFLI